MSDDESGNGQEGGPAESGDPGRPDSGADDYYKVYEGYEKTLRAWFVAYGIGGPILFMTNESVSQAFVQSAHGRTIGLAFLTGVALQVVLAGINKTVAWASYYSALRPEVVSKWRYRAAGWVGEQYWIDAGADLATLGLFGWATWAAFNLVTAVR